MSQKNDKNHVFCLQVFYKNSSLQNQKSKFTVKFNPCSSLEVTFFVLIRFPGPSHSLLFQCILAFPRFSTSLLHCILPPLFLYLYQVHGHSDLQRKFRTCCNSQWSQIPKYVVVGQEIHQNSSPKVTSFRSGHFSSSTSNKPNSQTKYITLLASLKKWASSWLPSRLMMLIRQQLKMKNGYKLTKNSIQTKLQPLLQLNEAK